MCLAVPLFVPLMFVLFVYLTAMVRVPDSGDPSPARATKVKGTEQLETPARRRVHRPQDCAVIVAWLERFEDRLEFPVAELTASLHSPVNVSSGYFSTLTKKGSDFTLPVIFIHPLSSGLYRISTRITSYRLEEHLLLLYLWSSIH